MSKLNPLLEKISNKDFCQEALLEMIIYQEKNKKSLEDNILIAFNDAYQKLTNLYDFCEDQEYIILYSFPKVNYINNVFVVEIKAYESDKFLTQKGFNIGNIDVSWIKPFLDMQKEQTSKILKPKGGLVNSSFADYLILDSFEQYLNCLISLFSNIFSEYKNASQQIIFAFEKNKNNIVRL